MKPYRPGFGLTGFAPAAVRVIFLLVLAYLERSRR